MDKTDFQSNLEFLIQRFGSAKALERVSGIGEHSIGKWLKGANYTKSTAHHIQLLCEFAYLEDKAVAALPENFVELDKVSFNKVTEIANFQGKEFHEVVARCIELYFLDFNEHVKIV